ncbi:hypothetical protein DL89DRAFT_265126, partial [Linderina pennispora]
MVHRSDGRDWRFELPLNPVKVSENSVGPVSTMSDYFYVESFVKTCPTRVNELTANAFTVLILESNDPCDCDVPSCEKSHKRIWRSNLRTIDLLRKRHLIKEFRVIAHGVSKKLLNINQELTKLADSLGGPLATVRKILFLGRGLIQAVAAKVYHRLFPNVSDLTFHRQRKWGVSAGYTKLPPDRCTLFEQTFTKYMYQLEALQLHLTTPLEFHKFCENLSSLSINIQHIRRHRDLPLIPALRLRWIEGQLVFQSLVKIDFTFVVNAENKTAFPGYQYPIDFPVLGSLRVTNAIGVYDNIYAYFTSNTLRRLVVKDDPDAFEHIDWRVLQTVQRFEIEHPTGEFYKREYSSDSIQKLFAQESAVREVVMLGPVYYTLPRTINWHNLVLLDIAVAIADKDMLGNMVAQLPHLESLHINCVSMLTKDACDT